MKFLQKLESYFLQANKKLPSLPAGVKGVIARLLPYAIGLLGLLGVYLFASSIFGLLMRSSSAEPMVQPIALTIATLVLAPLMAIYALRSFAVLQHRHRKGLQYALATIFLYTALSLVALFVYWSPEELLVTIAIFLVSIYLIVQVHGEYEGKGRQPSAKKH